jgi:hypothetical protein
MQGSLLKFWCIQFLTNWQRNHGPGYKWLLDFYSRSLAEISWIHSSEWRLGKQMERFCCISTHALELVDVETVLNSKKMPWQPGIVLGESSDPRVPDPKIQRMYSLTVFLHLDLLLHIIYHLPTGNIVYISRLLHWAICISWSVLRTMRASKYAHK